METKKTSTCFNGKCFVAGTVSGLVIASLVVGFFAYRTSATEEPIQESSTEKKYVFCSIDGKHVVLSDFDVLNIKQMHDDGVLTSVIAKKYKLNVIMVSKIIETVNNFKK